MGRRRSLPRKFGEIGGGAFRVLGWRTEVLHRAGLMWCRGASRTGRPLGASFANWTL